MDQPAGSLTDKPSLVFSGHCKRCLNLARPADELDRAIGAPNRQTSFSQGDYYIPLPVVRSDLRFREIVWPQRVAFVSLFVLMWGPVPPSRKVRFRLLADLFSHPLRSVHCTLCTRKCTACDRSKILAPRPSTSPRRRTYRWDA